MRRSSAALLGLGLALGCDQSSPTATAETPPSLAKHDILHIDDRNMASSSSAASRAASASSSSYGVPCGSRSTR